MAVVWWVLIGLAAYFILGSCWVHLREAISPFRYRNVPFSELEDHLSEFIRRGLHGSELIVVAEGTHKGVRLRKSIETLSVNRPGMVEIHLIAEDRAEDRDTETGRFKLKAILNHEKIPFRFGLRGFRANRYGILVECGTSVETATNAARCIFHRFFALQDSTRYSLRLKGNMIAWDVYIDDRKGVSLRQLGMMVQAGIPLGRPYKRYHIPNPHWLESLLRFAFGRLKGWIRRLFRGP